MNEKDLAMTGVAIMLLIAFIAISDLIDKLLAALTNTHWCLPSFESANKLRAIWNILRGRGVIYKTVLTGGFVLSAANEGVFIYGVRCTGMPRGEGKNDRRRYIGHQVFLARERQP